MPQQIEGKIAKILDEYHIVINKGRNDCVQERMKFVIFSISNDDIKDSDTHESLGKLELVKGYVTAFHVQERATICVAEKTENTKSSEVGAGVQTLSGAMMAECMGRNEQIVTEKININVAQTSGLPQVSPISIGDCVRSVSTLL